MSIITMYVDGGHIRRVVKDVRGDVKSRFPMHHDTVVRDMHRFCYSGIPGRPNPLWKV